MKKYLIFSLLVFLLPSFAFAASASIDLERSSSQYLSITDASQTGLDFTGDFTIEGWVKLESSLTTG